MELFEIAAGTYEEFLTGYKFTGDNLIQTFASHDHSSSVRCLAVGDHYLASGGADDRIIVYDLKTRREHCLLTHHNSTISSLHFTPNHSHLVTAGADGMLAVVKTGSWAVEKLWDKAHKGASILDVALHPSGKLALTLGSDVILRTWNLIKGRQAFALNLNSKSKNSRSMDKLLWNEDGVRFVMYGGQVTEIWNIEQGGILKTINYDSKVSSCLWYSENELLVGLENGNLCLVNVQTESKKIHLAYNGRVKAISKFENWLITASSSGEITVWNQKKFKKIVSVNTGCRITCLVTIKPNQQVKIEKEDDKEEVEEISKTAVNKNKKSSVIIEIEDEDVPKKRRKRELKSKIDTQDEDTSEEQKINNKQVDKSNLEQVGTILKKKKKKTKNTPNFEEINTDNLEEKNKKINSNTETDWELKNCNRNTKTSVSKKNKKNKKELIK